MFGSRRDPNMNEPRNKSQLPPSPQRRRAWLAAWPAVLVLTALLPGLVCAEQPALAGKRTVLTSPKEALVTLRGPNEITAVSPIELEPGWSGTFEILIEAPGYASARGRIFFPELTVAPYARSEPSNLTGGVILRSLNFPGVSQILDHRTGRGIAFLLAGGGGAGAVLRDHLRYRSEVKESDVTSQDQAGDFRYARDRWAFYTGVVWGMSAIDYMARARMDVLESSPTRVTIGAPKLSRAGVLWRSALVPGAGQDYANHRGRGLAWLGATLASGAAYVVSAESLNRIQTKRARAEVLLASASPSEVAIRQEDVDHFTSLEEDSRNLVDTLALVTAGIYVANLIDAGILSFGGGSYAKKLSLSAPVAPRQAAIAIKYTF
jgi:hypothetical protein